MCVGEREESETGRSPWSTTKRGSETMIGDVARDLQNGSKQNTLVIIPCETWRATDTHKTRGQPWAKHVVVVVLWCCGVVW